MDAASAAGSRRELVAKHCEQALKSGSPLAVILTAEERSWIPNLIQPQWVSEAALRNLERMGLGEKALLRILDLLLNGLIRFPDLLPASGPAPFTNRLRRIRQNRGGPTRSITKSSAMTCSSWK